MFFHILPFHWNVRQRKTSWQLVRKSYILLNKIKFLWRTFIQQPYIVVVPICLCRFEFQEFGKIIFQNLVDDRYFCSTKIQKISTRANKKFNTAILGQSSDLYPITLPVKYKTIYTWYQFSKEIQLYM